VRGAASVVEVLMEPNPETINSPGEQAPGIRE
jgi:hypothetical protein